MLFTSFSVQKWDQQYGGLVNQRRRKEWTLINLRSLISRTLISQLMLLNTLLLHKFEVTNFKDLDFSTHVAKHFITS